MVEEELKQSEVVGAQVAAKKKIAPQSETLASPPGI
jgi:hypothetical protein